ncbi:MAG: HAD family phosphatase [Paracoccaceae bacterium]
MADLKLVIFDCDGVLVDSEGIFNRALVDDLETHGFTLAFEECAALFTGGTISSAKSVLEARGAILPDTWVEDFYIKVYAQLHKTVTAIPNVKLALERIKTAGIPYCVASNGRVEKMEITLGRTGLLGYFKDVMFSAQTLSAPKPAPELFLHAATTFGVSPADCVVIEDSLTGVLAAKRARMKCYAYTPHGGGKNLVAEGAILFKDMAKLPALLGFNP